MCNFPPLFSVAEDPQRCHSLAIIASQYNYIRIINVYVDSIIHRFFFRRLYVLHVKILDTYDVLLRVWPESVCRMASLTVEPNAPFQALNKRPGFQSRGGGTKSQVTSLFQIVIHQNSWLKGITIDIHRFRSSSKAVDVWKYPANQLRLLVLSHHLQEICYISKGD